MSEDLYTNPEEVRNFVTRLSDKTGSELSAIITRYISYRPEAVEAALYVSVEKGLMSYDLRELLWQQISSSFKAHESNIKHYRWEKGNAFVRYFAPDESQIEIDLEAEKEKYWKCPNCH